MPSTRPRLLSVRRIATLAALLVVAPAAIAAGPPDGPLAAPAPLAPDFAARVVATAVSLAERGPRPAGSPGERAAERAVARALREIGLKVERETFGFDGFEMKSSDLKLAGRTVPTVVVGFDPFRGPFEFEGEALVMKGGEAPPADVAGRIVVTDHPLVLLMLLDEKPALVVCVAEADFAAFAAGASRTVSLRVTGERRRHESANLVAALGPEGPRSRRVLVTAHLDAWQASPGANDNGTGLGALVELARHFKALEERLTVPVTFVAFGAEEVGALGSRVFVDRHRAELDDLEMVLNLDTLGGADGPQIGSKPEVEGVSATRRESRIPAEIADKPWEALDGSWRLLHDGMLPLVVTTCYPGWLQEIVGESAKELGLEPKQRNLISDHRTFMQAGVPAISIQSARHTIHSTGDTGEKLQAETIGKAGALAAAVLWKVEGRSRARVTPPGE
jgi:Iap family predicted aminopeptidase